MEEMISSSETRCKNPACKRLLAQTGGGHRQREYCDDACRQAARRHRVEQTHREEVDRRWATFTAETRGFLDWLTTRYSYGKDLAASVELAINREIDRYSAESSAQFEPALAALREKQLSRVEKLKARIAELEQAQRSPIEEQNIRRIEQYAIDCSLDAGQVKERIGALEQELADATQGRDQVQERFREYVCMTNERLGELTGELATLRQEQERAAGQEDQHTIEDYREKLLQAGQRITKLEKQVDIQRQQIGQYHQRFYPSSLAVAEQRLMVLGAALNYKILLKYDAQAVEVPSGEQAWREFATNANYDEVAQAILQAQYLFDNLYALGMVGKRDAPGAPNKSGCASSFCREKS